MDSFALIFSSAQRCKPLGQSCLQSVPAPLVWRKVWITLTVFGWVIQRHSMWEWSLRFLPFTFPFLFSKQNTIWASPSLDQNSGACPAYFYRKKKTHCFCTLPPLPMAGLLHRNIPQFSEFINLFFWGNEWRYSQLLNSRRNPLNFSVAILSGGCSFSRDISGGSAPTPNLFGFSKRRCHWGIRVSSSGSKV